MRPLLVILLALGAGCSPTVSTCQRAADHVAECLGEASTPAVSCELADAEAVLGRGCAEIAATDGKSDNPLTALICKLTGRWCPPAPSEGVPPLKYGEASPATIAAELEELASYGAQIQQVQRNNAAKHGGSVDRGFHAKTHLCVRGELSIAQDRPAFARFGLLKDQATHPVWVRWSSAMGHSQADARPDTRGMAVKVEAVTGTPLSGEAQPSAVQDLLSSTAPTQLFPDARGAMEYALAESDPDPLAYPRYLAEHPAVAAALARYLTTFPVLSTSLANHTFWSSSVVSLGPRAIKFNFRPCEQKLPRAALTEDYLRDDLERQLARESICYELRVQFQADPSLGGTPIEDASVAWETPSHVVGTLTIPRKSDRDVEEEEAACAGLSFSPWHAIDEHRPLGNVNRARRVIYEASRSLRQGR